MGEQIMRKLIGMFIAYCICFVSCTNSKKKTETKRDNSREIMDVTNYTGNAVAFFSPGDQNSETISIIPVAEKDSNIFKQDDIYKSVKGKCAIRIMVGDSIRQRLLLNSPEKKSLSSEICNVPDDVYYAKVWVSYKGYLENKPKSKFVNNSDSCSVRVLGWSVDENGKVTSDGIKQFIVLKNCPN